MKLFLLPESLPFLLGNALNKADVQYILAESNHVIFLLQHP